MVETSLYFHIPFCTKKCPYCHFYVVPNRSLLRTAFKEGLKAEWEQRLPLLSQKKIVSIYFGGGTPTLYAPEGIEEILGWIYEAGITLAEDCEITIEGNPEELELSLLRQLRSYGINRISLGVQSLDDSSLAVLERRHSAVQAKAAIMSAYAAGFQNITIDLMYDLPWQTEQNWGATLSQIQELPISHLSLYNLTLEEHTSFYKKREILKKTMPQGDLSLKLLEMGIETCEKEGLFRYEISAFAKKGFESKHNSGYWKGRPFLGFGPSAFSYWGGKRFRNNSHLQRYRKLLVEGKNVVEFEEALPYPDNWNELLAIHLRLFEGVETASWPLPPETLERLDQLEGKGLLISQETRWKLSPQGVLFYDTVAEELITISQ